jgi:hypothetical protein
MTLKVTRRLRPTAIAAMTAATLTAAVCAGLALAGSAFADHGWGSQPPTLNGDWASLNRCPVDNPAMLAIEGTTTEALCLSESTPSGSMTIGNLSVALKGTNHQEGDVQSRELAPSPLISPPGGILVAEPVELPGGIQGLICPQASNIAASICAPPRHHHHRWWRDARAEEVTWTLESAGSINNFNLLAGLIPGTPISTVPLKVHLQNWALGNDCYIGSEAEPIVVQPFNVAPAELETRQFEPNGTPNQEAGIMTDLHSSHVNQGANAFTVPAASGCGHHGYLDQAIDEKAGLPSSAGTNSLTFNEATTDLVGLVSPEGVAPNDGKELAKDWHSAVLPPEMKGHGFDHGHGGGYRFGSDEEAEEYTRHRFGPRH